MLNPEETYSLTQQEQSIVRLSGLNIKKAVRNASFGQLFKGANQSGSVIRTGNGDQYNLTNA